MARKPRALSKESKASDFVRALQFVCQLLQDTGAPHETHVFLHNNSVTVFNGVLAAGVPIDEDLYACPHGLRLLEALKRCDEAVSITQLDSGRLSIKSGKFRALVPCVDPGIMPSPQPDPICAAVNDDFKTALGAMSVFGPGENAQHVALASVLMAGRSLVGTDSALILECWHGCDLPPGVVLPRSIIGPLSKAPAPLASFGYSANSATFYFENRSWLKTQLYADKWPDMGRVLNVRSNLLPIPKGFWQAFHAVYPFSENDCVYLADNQLRSHATADLGASYDVDDLPSGIKLSGKRLKMIEAHANAIDFIGINSVVYFSGAKARGALATMTGE